MVTKALGDFLWARVYQLSPRAYLAPSCVMTNCHLRACSASISKGCKSGGVLFFIPLFIFRPLIILNTCKCMIISRKKWTPNRDKDPRSVAHHSQSYAICNLKKEVYQPFHTYAIFELPVYFFSLRKSQKVVRNIRSRRDSEASSRPAHPPSPPSPQLDLRSDLS